MTQTQSSANSTRPNRYRSRELLFFLAVALAATWGFWPWLVSTYRTMTGAPVKWREQVKLSGGDIVVVRRSVDVDKRFEIGGPSFWFHRESTIVVEGERSGAQTPLWRAPFLPLLLERDAQRGIWSIVARLDTCEAWVKRGRPPLPYVRYRLEGDAWTEIPLGIDLLGAETNLLTEFNVDSELPFVDLRVKQERSSARTPDITYRRIVSTWNNCRGAGY